MTSLSVHSEALRLNIADYATEDLRRVAESGGVLYWHNDGILGKVQNGVLRDVLELWDDYQTLRKRHPDAEIPPGVGVIAWEQVVTPRDLSAAEQARTLRPRSQPPRRERRRTRG